MMVLASQSGNSPRVDRKALTTFSKWSFLSGVADRRASRSCSPADSTWYRMKMLDSGVPRSLQKSISRSWAASRSRDWLPSTHRSWLDTCRLACSAAASAVSRRLTCSGECRLVTTPGIRLASRAVCFPWGPSASSSTVWAMTSFPTEISFQIFSQLECSKASSRDCWCRTACFKTKSYSVPYSMSAAKVAAFWLRGSKPKCHSVSNVNDC